MRKERLFSFNVVFEHLMRPGTARILRGGDVMIVLFVLFAPPDR